MAIPADSKSLEYYKLGYSVHGYFPLTRADYGDGFILTAQTSLSYGNSFDGSIVNTVTITRSHLGSTADLWEKVANVSYLRLYVPQGSTLLSTDGFDDDPSVRYLLPDLDAIADIDLEAIEKTSLFDEHTGMRITAEAEKTVFGNWISIDPGETQTVTVQYMLPFKLNVGGLFNRTDKYSLLLQMQPGAENVFFQSTVQIPDQYNIAWAPDNVIQEGNQVQYTADVITDLYYGILLEK